ncbi:hypothetical protein [Saccharopolyspora soli]|nr:hypothetical protein [Saccharopolyspora soli]
MSWSTPVEMLSWSEITGGRCRKRMQWLSSAQAADGALGGQFWCGALQ